MRGYEGGPQEASLKVRNGGAREPRWRVTSSTVFPSQTIWREEEKREGGSGERGRGNKGGGGREGERERGERE